MAPPATVEDSRALAGQLPRLVLGESDGAASTLQAERDYLAAVAGAVRLIEGRAVWRDSGTQIPIPPGWDLVAINGVPVLRGPMKDGFADNIVVEVTANLLGYTLDEVEAETLRLLKDVLRSEVLAQDRTTVGGRDAWVVETLEREVGSNMVLHQQRAVFFTAYS